MLCCSLFLGLSFCVDFWTGKRHTSYHRCNHFVDLTYNKVAKTTPVDLLIPIFSVFLDSMFASLLKQFLNVTLLHRLLNNFSIAENLRSTNPTPRCSPGRDSYHPTASPSLVRNSSQCRSRVYASIIQPLG